MVDRLVIVVPEDELALTQARLSEVATLGWEAEVRLIEASRKKRPGNFAQTQSQKFLTEAEEFGCSKLIVAKEVCCDSKFLQSHSEIPCIRPAVGHLRQRVLVDELRARKLLWKENAIASLAQLGVTQNEIDSWLRQFQSIEAPRLGRNLLKQVKVVGTTELRRAFKLSQQALIGADFRFTFVGEVDYAASSNRVGGILTQLYGTDRVGDLRVVLECSTPEQRIVICEDALWTGNEFTKILRRLGPQGDLEAFSKNKKILFRHCVVTDFGIQCARQVIDHYGLSDEIDLLLDDSQIFLQILPATLTESLVRSHWSLSPPEFEEWLAKHVEPLAFRNEQVWGNTSASAQGLCESVGRQLIDRYVRLNKKEWSLDVQEGFALGARRFGAVTTFAHGVPKVCLPVLWLEGPISANGRSIHWQPLFFDARRIQSVTA